jgi:hypothetical protein
MALTVTFTTFAEKMPEDGQRILVLNPSSLCSSMRVITAVLAHVWDEVDENGDETGGSVLWSPDDKEAPEGCVLSTYLDSEEMGSFSIEPADMWAPFDPIDEALCANLEAAEANRAWGNFPS